MMTLSNDRLKVSIADPEDYCGTRFDHTLTVKQVELDGKHTFLGHEETPAGIGTGGFGLHCGWLWRNPITHQVGYPIPGIGILTLAEHQEYSIRENFPFIPALRSVVVRSETQYSIESIIPDVCRVVRALDLSGNTITLSTKISNLSTDVFDIEEYCHNFIQFDGYPIDHHVQVAFSGPLLHSVVRGELKIGSHWYEPVTFDTTLGTIALACEKQEVSEYPHTVTLFDQRTGTYVSIHDGFSALRGYQWISEYCICPESFHQMTIHPQQEERFFRKFSFGTQYLSV
jgi:hypothetical protein